MDKAQLTFECEALWQRQIRLLQQIEPREVFISARAEPTWRPRKIELILDETPSRGPMSGICAALSWMTTSHLLVLAVDMPFILGDDLQKLVNSARTGCGVVPVTGSGAEPLAAIYPKASEKDFRTALSSDDTSLQRLVSQLAKLRMIDFLHLSQDETERYRSVNEPGDFIERAACC